MPIVYSVHLFANALRMSLDQKCKHGSGYLEICRNLQSMPAAEWMSVLRTASTIMNGPEGPKRVRFQMETVHHVSLYMWNAIARNFDLVIIAYNLNTLYASYNTINTHTRAPRANEEEQK